MTRRRKRETGFLDILLGRAPSRPYHYERYVVPHYYPQHYPQYYYSNNPLEFVSAPLLGNNNNNNKNYAKPKKVHFTNPEVTDSYQSEDEIYSTTSHDSSDSDDEVGFESDIPSLINKETTTGKSASHTMAKTKSKGKDGGDGEAGKQVKGNTKQDAGGKSNSEGKGKGKDKDKKRKGRKLVIYISESSASDTEGNSSSDEPAEDHNKQKSSEENKKPEKPHPDNSSQPKSSPHPNPPSHANFDKERALSNQYFYTQALSKQYPDQVHLQPDDFWSAEDCSILATLEARQRALKWHHLQSEFYNATGRMVSIELLQAKLEPAATPKSS